MVLNLNERVKGRDQHPFILTGHPLNPTSVDGPSSLQYVPCAVREVGIWSSRPNPIYHFSTISFSHFPMSARGLPRTVLQYALLSIVE
jgi:hypothetical protein